MPGKQGPGRQEKTGGAVIYTRVSTGEQDKHGTSPEAQLYACRQKALALSVPIVAEYYDGGISGGFLLARPEFQSAIDTLRAGRADTLICPNISRYSRDVEHQHAVKKAVKAAGGRLVFCDAEFEDTAAGDLNFTIQGGFAEYERKVIRERCIGGHRRRAEAGIQTARVTAPYGYAIPTKADILRGLYPAELLGKYLIAEEQAAVAREIFARYAAGADSISGLCRWLNSSGTPTPGRAAQWRVSVLQYLLQNPVYKGRAAYGRFDHATDESRMTQCDPATGRPYLTLKTLRRADPSTWITWDVPALVSEETWAAAEARLVENRRALSGNPHQVRMLTGRVCCPHCGTSMVCASPGKRRRADGSFHTSPPRYVCNRYRETLRRTGHGECFPDGYSVERVEQAVITALMDACEQPASIARALETYARTQEKPVPRSQARQEMGKIDAALRGLEARQSATVQAQIAGIMAKLPADAYNGIFADLAAERKDLEDRRGVLSRQLQPLTPPGTVRSPALPDRAEILDTARRVLSSPEFEGRVKRDILGRVIEQVICQKAEEVAGEGKQIGAEIVFRPGTFGEAAFGEAAFGENVFGEEAFAGKEEAFSGSSLRTSRKVRDADHHRLLRFGARLWDGAAAGAFGHRGAGA